MNIDQRVQNSIYRTGSLCRTRLRLTCARSLTATLEAKFAIIVLVEVSPFFNNSLIYSTSLAF
jgi:hypothetical protein